MEDPIDRVVDCVKSFFLRHWHKFRMVTNVRHRGTTEGMLRKNRAFYETCLPEHRDALRLKALRAHFDERARYHEKRWKEESYGK